MENSKLLKLLSKLSKQEFLSLGFYLKTPSFNKNKDLISLYEALSPFAPSFIAKKIDATEIFSQIYKNNKFNNIKLNHLCSLLTISTQNFLASIELRKEEYIKERLLLKRYDNKKFTDDFKIETKNFKNHLDQKRPLDLEGHYHDFWLERASFYHAGNIKTTSAQKNQFRLEQAFNNLNHFYWLARLELICEMANRENITTAISEKRYYDLSFLPEKIKSITSLENISNSIDLYLVIFNTLRKRDIEDGLKKVPKINDYINKIKISPNEKSIVSVFLINFISRSLVKYPKKGRIAYAELMISKLDAGEFVTGGYITPSIVINLAFIGVGLNRLDLAYEIRDKYSSKIIKEKKEATTNLINAAISHGEKKYEKCIDYLNLIHDNDFDIKVNLDLLYIRTYYELIKKNNKSAEKLFYIYSKRYKKYLQQTKNINIKYIESNLTLLLFMDELVLHLKNKTQESILDYKNKIEQSNIPLKLWFYDKIKEIVFMRKTTSSK